MLPPIFGAANTAVAQADPLDRTYLAPQRVVWTYGGADGKLVQNTDVLLTAGNGQADMAPTTRYCRMVSTENEKPSLMLDYGRELHGGLQLVMGGGDRRPSLVRIRFGESVGEANSQTLNTEWKVGFATDDHAKRDIVVEIPRTGSIEIGNTGFRFVRIDLLENNRTINIKEARAILRIRNIPYLGSFRCSDERLNQIWATAAYTVHLNMQEFLWDGIKRDRCVWLGDMHPEVMTIKNVFGNNPVVPQSLDLACTQFPLPGWMNGMSAYSFWYLIIHKEWYMHHGDLTFLQKHKDYIVGLIDFIAGKINEDGSDSLGGRMFLDWPSSPNQPGVAAGYRALLTWAMRDAKELCTILKQPAALAQCDVTLNRLGKQTLPDNGLKQAAALMAIAGIVDAAEACNKVVSVDGAKGFSTFYGYYMLEAQAKAGQQQQAMDVIRQYWGAMLDLGATSFWEDFDLDWIAQNPTRIDELPQAGKKDIHGDFGAYCYPGYRHSLCHGWSSGPASWLIEHVLGVQILEAGCKTLKVAPFLGDLDWAEGNFPTPHGVVKISHKKLPNGTIDTKVEGVKGVRIMR
ncbi:MAG: alpha-L-rhamnosidase [Prevotellaceae bacterium]|nr:alpha-L-rhamnosidase [Prevotellaceae bacterium]